MNQALQDILEPLVWKASLAFQDLQAFLVALDQRVIQDSQDSKVHLAFLALKVWMVLQALLVLVEHLVGQEILDDLDYLASLVIKVLLVVMVFQDLQDKRVNKVSLNPKGIKSTLDVFNVAYVSRIISF